MRWGARTSKLECSPSCFMGAQQAAVGQGQESQEEGREEGSSQWGTVETFSRGGPEKHAKSG